MNINRVFYYTLCYSFLHLTLVAGEIITLKRGTNITCVVTDDDINSAIISYPQNSNLRRKKPLHYKWLDNNWTEYNLSYLDKIDSRWTELELTKGTEINLELPNENIPVSFSACLDVNDTVQLINEDKWHNIPLQLLHAGYSCLWTHFKISHTTLVGVDYHRLYITHNGTTKEINVRKNTPITIRSAKSILWKIHDHAIWMCPRDRSRCEKETQLEFYHEGPLCISFFTSLGQGQVLRVSLISGSKIVHKIVTDSLKQPFSYKMETIEIDAEGMTRLKFYGKLSESSGELKYWQISNINYCHKNYDVFEGTGESCNSIEKQRVNRVDEYNCKERGKFGRKCDLNCSEILGKAYEICQLHQIHTAKRSFCNFGLYGDTCESILRVHTSEDEITVNWSEYLKYHNKTEYETYSLRYNLTRNEMCPNPSEIQKTLKLNISKSSQKIKGFRITSIEYLGSPENVLIDYIKIDQTATSISDEELPLNITVNGSSIEIFLPHCEKLKTELNYSINFKCQSFWCRDEIIDSQILNKYSYNVSHIEYKIDKLLQFTHYVPIINATRHGHVKLKAYPVIKTPLISMQHIQTYCVAGNSLWIKWPSARDSRNYSLIIDDGKSLPINVTIDRYEKCKEFEKYICRKIENLKPYTNYAITVFERNSNSLSKTTVRTMRQGAELIKNIQFNVSSNLTLSITWMLALESLCSPITIHVESTKINITEQLKPNGRASYKYDVPIRLQTQYNISIDAGDAKTRAQFFLYRSKSSDFLKTYCIEKKCFYSIPKLISLPKNWSSYQIQLTNQGIQQNFHESAVMEDESRLLVATNQTFQTLSSLDGKIKVFVMAANYTENQNNSMTFLIDNVYKAGYNQIQIIIVFSFTALVILVLLAILFYIIYKKFESEKTMSRPDSPIYESIAEKPDNFELMPTDTKIKLVDLDFYIKHILLNNEKNNRIIDQFRNLQAQSNLKSRDVALDEVNVSKNRFRDNVPFDSNRVILQDYPGLGSGDYINASHINGYDRPGVYIVAQSPKYSTVKDFWRMIWLNEIRTIIMATDFMENKERKCIDYWPCGRKGDIIECGSLTIKLKKVKNFEHFSFAILYIQSRSPESILERKIQHFWLRWNPDWRVPLYSENIVSLLTAVNESAIANEPVLVHCGSGSSRSAVIILCNLAIEMAMKKEKVDFFKLTKKLRAQRPNMIQREDQYVLAHLVVSEYLMKQDLVNISHQNNLQALLAAEIKFIESCCSYDQIIRASTPRHVYDQPTGAIEIQTYSRLRSFFAIKVPSSSEKSSLFNFWDLVVKEKLKYVLFLNKAKINLTNNVVLPSKTVISIISVVPNKTDFYESTTYIYNVIQNRVTVSGGQITVIQLVDWPSKNLLPNSLLSVFYAYHQGLLKLADHNENILIACYDGVTACGLFGSLCYLTDKIKQESQIDICNSVRIVRRSGINYLRSDAQLKFLHEAAVEFKENYDPYYTSLDVD